MPNIRMSKERAYSGIQIGSLPGNAGAYRFDALASVPMFYTTAVINNGQANTVVNDVFVCAQRLSIVKLVLIVNTDAYAQATDAWNVVVGTGAENGASGAAQALAVAGNSVFATDKALTGLAVSKNYQVFSAIPDVPETWYDAGTVLTLRYATGSTAGAHTATVSGFDIQVFGLLVAVDPKPMVGTANPATDF